MTLRRRPPAAGWGRRYAKRPGTAISSAGSADRPRTAGCASPRRLGPTCNRTRAPSAFTFALTQRELVELFRAPAPRPARRSGSLAPVVTRAKRRSPGRHHSLDAVAVPVARNPTAGMTSGEAASSFHSPLGGSGHPWGCRLPCRSRIRGCISAGARLQQREPSSTTSRRKNGVIHAHAHLIWATMHGLVAIELMHRRWGGPSSRTCSATRSTTTRRPPAHSSKRSTAARQEPPSFPL
jgi:hypothetical protein